MITRMSYVGVRMWTHPFNIRAEALQTVDVGVALANRKHPQYALTFMVFVILCMSLVATWAVTLFGVPLPIEVLICECVVIYHLLKFT